MSGNKNNNSSSVGVAILKFGDKPAWQLALKILDEAGIPAVCEGGLGWLEICVNASQAEVAAGLLSKEAALKGKLFTLN